MAGNRFKAEKSALNTSSSKSAPRSSRFQHDTDGHSALIKKPPLGERRSKAAIGLAVIDEAQAAHTTVVHFLHEAMLETTGEPFVSDNARDERFDESALLAPKQPGQRWTRSIASRFLSAFPYGLRCLAGQLVEYHSKHVRIPLARR